MAEELWIVDRFEERLAVLESHTGTSELRVPRPWLPRNTQEGDVLRLQRSAIEDESHVTFSRDQAETERRRRDMRERAARLRKRDPGGDIKL